MKKANRNETRQTTIFILACVIVDMLNELRRR